MKQLCESILRNFKRDMCEKNDNYEKVNSLICSHALRVVCTLLSCYAENDLKQLVS